MREKGKGKKQNTVKIAEELMLPVLEELGLELWDTRFEKEGATWYLRYFIDKKGGVTIQDLEAASRRVDKLLDEADPIEQSYTLEVCSPGIERKLTRDEHFKRYLGQRISVRLIRPVAGVRDFIGVLAAKDAAGVHLIPEGDGGSGPEMVIQPKEAAYIKVYADFETGGLE